MANLITLANFNQTDGASPNGSLIVDAEGDLFGTTQTGGASGDGTVFEIVNTPTGYASVPTTLASFNGSNGNSPSSELIMDAAGNLYGTTQTGGANGDGTVFEIAKTATGYASTPTTLVSFNGTDGSQVYAGLTFDAAGNLLGTTAVGGANGKGTLFEVAKTGSGYANTPTTIVNFSDGATPVAGLITDANGDLFGTTSSGGPFGAGFGTAFEVPKTASGYAAPVILAAFNGDNGSSPDGGLVADANGDLFGTANGGPGGNGVVYEIAKTADGYADAPTILVSFNLTDGAGPVGSLIMDAAGNLFGVTSVGGQFGSGGEVFEIAKTADGYASTPILLASFDYNNGANPGAGLVADAAGNLFGTTNQGGSNGDGTAFEITSSGFVPLTVSIDGTAQQGQTLTASADGDVATYQWQELIGGNWLDIGGANAASYVVQQGDIGRQIRVEITSNGSLAATSAATATVLDAAGNQYVYDTTANAVIGNGVFQYVYGTAIGTTVNDGGEQNIYGGGTATGTTLNAGGVQVDWGTANNTTLDGGSQYVWSTATVATIIAGTQYVGTGGTANGGTVDAAGVQLVDAGGTATGMAIDGGSQSVFGTADQTTINNGGLQNVHGSVTNTTVDSGGEQNVYADGTATGSTLNAGGTQVDWGSASSTTVDGGNQYVWGTDTGATITSGTQFVEAGGTASNAALEAQGAQIVGTSGTATGTSIFNGGSQSVFGTADQTGVGLGGFQNVYGSATNTTVGDLGTQDVYAGGTASNTTVSNFGTQDIYAVGSASNTTIGFGATADVFAGGTVDGVTFDDTSATLDLAQSSGLTGSIAGWQSGDAIGLGDISFSAGTTLGFQENSGNTGGILTVSDGSHVATLALLGQYMAADFALSSNGSGGTLVTDPGTTNQPEAQTVLAGAVHA